MASASSSSGSVLERERGPNAPRKYDVFISFRGEDTRNNFTSHLHAALKRASLEVFLDDKKLEKGEEIKPSLIQAIKDSSVSVIVFSKDYASSKWCLDELAQIMQYRKEEGQFVIPIFYNVNPRNVRNQTKAYKKAFNKHEMDYPTDRVNTWRAALSEAGNLSGMHCQASTDETKLIKDIVSDVSTKLEDIPNWRVTLKGVIGRDEMIEPIKELLEKYHKVGIWGMGGVGKTTMAKVAFATLSSQYDSRYFLDNVREKIKKNGLEHVRNSLVSKLLGEDVQIDSSNEESFLRRLRRTKALVVLDDVDTTDEQLISKNLLDNTCNVLGEGSKVIITTRDQKLLKGRKDYEIYEAKGLSYENSRRLFIHKAFGSDNPEDGYEELIKGFVDYTKHNPLALEVLGSHVCSEDKQLWCELLRKLRDGNPDEKIHKALRLSYKRLDPNGKQIFLDIACFLKGESEGFVKKLMESYGFYPDVGMQTLKDKALINTIDGKVEMHDLIQEMGHQIVREESIKPEKRSRLWDPSEISDVLKNCKEAKEVEGIAGWISPSDLTPKTFKKMRRLRFLKIFSRWPRFSSDTGIQSGFKSFSTQIRYFHWDSYPWESLPSNFCAEHLLELNLKDSLVETLWEGVKELVNLRRLNLHGCDKLKEIPDFSRACRLERVDLSHCGCLCKVHKSLLTLHSLISLDLSFCYKLESLQSEIHLRSLKQIDMSGCYGLKEFSVSSEELTSLDLSLTKIEELSPSIGRCSKLRKLGLFRTNLKNFPVKVLSCLTFLAELQLSGLEIDNDGLQKLFDRLHSIQLLKLERCWSFTELPDNITQLSSLEGVALEACPDLTNLPVNMKLLSKLQYLSLTSCIKLWSLPELPPSLSKLNVQHCKSLENVPFSMPLSLESLQLEDCHNLTKLPNNIRNLSKLQDLSVKSCIFLQSIPDLPPSLRKLIAKNCWSLETMSISTISSTTENYGEKIFSFVNCIKLDLGAIEEEAKLLFEKANHEKEDVTVCYTGEKVPVWFGNNRTQKGSNPIIKLSLSSHTLVGFVFCVVITADISEFNSVSILFNIEEDEKTLELLREFSFSSPIGDLRPGNVLLCSCPKVSQSILEKIEGHRRNHEAATYNPNLSLQLGFDWAGLGDFCPIEGWGVYPVYSEVNSNSKERKAM